MKRGQTVLLMRVLSSAELHNTRHAPSRILQIFPESRLIACGLAGCETTALLGADDRISDLLLLPPHVAQSPRAFRRFMASQSCDATVMCFGATPGINYPKQILESLLCPGRKFFLDAADRLFPAWSAAGLRVILRAAVSIAARALLRVLLLLLAALQGVWAHGTQADVTQEAGLPSPEAVRRLLFVRLDHIGDMAMSLPALHALRQRYPEAQIDALVLPSVAPLLADVPDLDTVITYAAPVFTRSGPHAGLRETLSLVRRLRRARYDTAVELRGNDLCRLMAFLSGAARRIGPAQGQYEPPGRPNYRFLMTHTAGAEDGVEDAVEHGLQLLHSCGLPLPDEPYRLAVTPQREAQAQDRLESLGVWGDYAVVHARPSEAARQWSVERFAAVVDHLTRRHGLNVLLTGMGADREYNERIREQVAVPERVMNAAGSIPLPELPALFQRAALMVSVDTGPMHIAALVGTPLVTLFQPGLARLHAPYQQRDGVLTPPADARGADASLTGISVDEVLAAIERKFYVSAKISLRLVSNSSDVITPASLKSVSEASRSLIERVADAA